MSSINVDKIFGFIINLPHLVKLGWLTVPVKRPHWIAVRKVDQDFVNLDSKLDEPKRIGNAEELQTFLQDQLKTETVQIFLIVTSAVSKEESWKKM